eukprot:g30475.t1
MGRKNRDSSDSESESDRRAKVGFDDRPSYSSGEVCPRSQEKKGRKDDKRKALVQSFMSMILHEPLFIPSVLASCANLALWQDRRSRGRSKERRKERSAERKPAPKRGRSESEDSESKSSDDEEEMKEFLLSTDMPEEQQHCSGQHRLLGHRRFDEIKTKPTWFVIKHFAGPVSYCTDSFLDKNRDQLSTDLIECVGNSSNQFVANVFRRDPKFADAFVKEEDRHREITANFDATIIPQDWKSDKAKTKKKKYTVSSEFKDQLSSLMDVVDLTEPHFIRCIKPNPQNVPDLFDRKGVTEQLRYGGVLQVVQVSRAGYPDPKIRAQKLLDHLDTELNIPKPKHGQSWAVGKTLVFFKLPAYERIKFARLELVIKSTTMIQANWRGKVRRRMYIAIRLFTRHVQALLRSKQARADLFQRRSEDSARKIQAHARSKIVLPQDIQPQLVGTKAPLQRRRRSTRASAKRSSRSRRLVRKQREQKIYDALKHSIIFAQQRLRMRNAKNQLKKLKQEAKEAQKAAEQASELRKHNEELEAHQLQLQSENKTLSHKAQAAEAAKFAADETKTVIETEKMEAMNKQMSERDEELAGLRKELQEMKESHAKQQEALKSAEANYQQLLKSTTLQSVGAGAAGTVAPVRSGGSRGHRNRRTGFSDPELTSCRLEMPEVLSGADASESEEVLDWNSCLTIGLGEGVATALRRTGLQGALAKVIVQIRAIGGLPQVGKLEERGKGHKSGNGRPGLLVANAALALDNEYGQLSSRQLLLLIVISSNMVLNVPMPDELMRNSKRAFSVRSVLLWSLPTFVLVAALTSAWTLLFQLQ